MEHRSLLSATGASHEDVVAGREAGQSTADQLDRVLTPQEVAEWLKVRPRELGRLGVPYLDWGHKTKRYLARDVAAWLEEQRQAHRRGLTGLLATPTHHVIDL